MSSKSPWVRNTAVSTQTLFKCSSPVSGETTDRSLSYFLCLTCFSSLPGPCLYLTHPCCSESMTVCRTVLLLQAVVPQLESSSEGISRLSLETHERRAFRSGSPRIFPPSLPPSPSSLLAHVPVTVVSGPQQGKGWVPVLRT